MLIFEFCLLRRYIFPSLCLTHNKREKQMNDTSRSNKCGLLVALGSVTLIVVLIIVSKSPATFLSWFLTILVAFSLLLLFAFVFALVVVVLGAVLRRYRERQRQETDEEPLEQQLPRHPRRTRRRQR